MKLWVVTFKKMGRIRKAGYVFERWVGDHKPSHVHVYKDARFIAVVNLEDLTAIKGKINRRLKLVMIQLIKEGLL